MPRDPGIKGMQEPPQPADGKKRLLRNLFKGKNDSENTPTAVSLEEPADSLQAEAGSSGYIVRYSDELDMEQVRQILHQINREEDQYNASLNRRELEILASDRLLLASVNETVEGLTAANLARYEDMQVEARQQVADTSKTMFIVAIIALLAGIIMIVVLVVDLNRVHSYRVKLEEAKDYAERLAQARQRFLANMSHEIRTPLNAIAGFAEQLRHGNKQTFADSAEHIHKASGHLLEIVNDILDYSKMEFGKMQLQSEPFRLQHVVDEVSSLLRPRAEAKGLDWQVELDEGAQVWVLGDVTRLRQVLINLAGNAIKFTDKGHVRIELRSQLRDRYTDFSLLVSDTGIGMPPEAAEHIFDDFSQLDNSDSRAFGGTGLGLAITKKIVDQHHGHIMVDARPGEGSIFIVDLSYRNHDAEAPTEEAPEEGQSFRLDDCVVLVADDEPFNIQLASLILRKAGATVLTSADGHTAIDLAREEAPDLFLLDLHMPGLEGREVARTIREQRPDARIVAVTADVVTPVAELLDGPEFDDVLHKPYKEQDLIGMTARMLDRKAPAQVTEDDVLPVDEYAPYSLEEIRAFAGEDDSLVQDVVQTFLEAAPQQVAELSQALARKDVDKVREVAHRMLPAFQHFHIDVLVPQLRAWEVATQIEEEHVEESRQHLEAVTTEVFQALEAWLAPA